MYLYCITRRFSSRVKRNIDGTYRWPRPLDGGILITNSSIRFSYIVHSIVALQLPAAERSCSVLFLFLFLSWRCPGDLHEIGDPSVGRPVDLSLEWKSRIEIFSSARAEAVLYVFRDAVLSRLHRSIPIRVAFLSTCRVTGPKNIGFALPPRRFWIWCVEQEFSRHSR